MKVKRVKKIKSILFLSIISLLTLGALSFGFKDFLKVEAAPLADPSDIFYVDLPRPSTQIYGISTLRFKIFDDENANPEYSASLFQTDCKTKFGTIVQNDRSIKNSSNIYTKSWNTNGPILDKASIPNGNYCLKVCVTLKNGTTNYAVCDLRSVKIVDQVNHAPVITSILTNTNFLIGQTFSYDVNATDADNDKLTYSLTSAPKFLQIVSLLGVTICTFPMFCVG